MKLAVFYYHLLDAARQTGLPFEEVAARATAAGISAVELNLSHLEADPALPEKLAACGLGVSSLVADYQFDRDAAGARLDAHVDWAARCGAGRAMIVPGFFGTPEENDPAVFDRAPLARATRAAFARAVERGAQKGVTVTIEDYDHDRSPVRSTAHMAWFLDRVPGLMVTLDTGNFVHADEDVCAGLALFRDKIRHVHCKDRGADPQTARGTRCAGLAPVAVGDGYLPIAPVVSSLLSSGYDGFFTIEHFGAPDHLAYMTRSAAFLQSLQ